MTGADAGNEPGDTLGARGPRAPARAYPGHARFLPYLLNRVTSRLNVDFQAELHRHGLTLTHWRVLAFLSEQDGLPVTELATVTATDPSTLSRALDRLERDGHVERRGGDVDQRVTRVHLAAPGRALFERILPTALALHRQAVRGLTADDLHMLSKILSRILVNLG